MTRLCTFGFDDASEYFWGIAQDEGLASGQKVASIGMLKRTPTTLANGSGLGCLFIGGGGTYWQYNLGDNVADLYFAGSFYFQGLTNGSTIISFDTRTDLAYSSTLNIIWNTDGSISLRRGTTVLASSAAGSVAINTRYCLECYVKPRNSGGEFTVRLDGVQVATSGSADTTDNAETTDSFRLVSPTTSVSVWGYWDDVICNSNAGSTNNTWIGRVTLTPLVLTGAGDNTELSRGGMDMGANFAQVRDSDPGGVSFLQGNLDDYDLYTVDVPDLPAGVTINNIIVQATGKSTSGTGEIALMVKGGATEDDSADKILTASTMIFQNVWAVNPDDSAAWAESDLADLQIGVKIRT